MNQADDEAAEEVPGTLWTKNDVAKLLQISVKSVERLMAKKAIKSVKVMSMVRFRPDDVREFVSQLQNQSSAAVAAG